MFFLYLLSRRFTILEIDSRLHLVASLVQQGGLALTLSVWQRIEDYHGLVNSFCERTSPPHRLRSFRRGSFCLSEFFCKNGSRQGGGIENSAQFDAFLGFVSSQRLGPKTTTHPDAALLSLLHTRLAKNQSVQQIYASSVLEAEAASTPSEDLATETGFSAKKRGVSSWTRSPPRSRAVSRLPPRVRCARCSR